MALPDPDAPPQRAATLRQVAAAAEVSLSTAARVLRGERYPVDAAVRARVATAARQLRYVPNVLARNLRRGTPTMVGLVVGNMLEPYYGEIAQAVTEHAEGSQAALAIVCNMQRDPLLELKYCRQLWENRVAGLILAGGLFDQWSHREELAVLLRQMTTHGVAVTALSPRGLEVPVFSADNRAVGACMAAHLLAQGHRDVGILLGPPQSEVAQQRLAGAANRLAQAGARFAVQHTDYAAAAVGAAAVALCGRRPRLTGLIVGSDSMALAAAGALAAASAVVPAVIGVGNTRADGIAGPPLPTVDVGLGACGRAALDHILHRVAGRPPPTFVPPLPAAVLPSGAAGAPGCVAALDSG